MEPQNPAKTETPPEGFSDSSTIARGAAVNFLGTLAKFSRTIFTIFVTRVFGAQTFGIFTLATSVIDLVSRFTIFGLDKALLKYVPEVFKKKPGDRYAYLSASLIIAFTFSAVTTIALYFFAPVIAEIWLKNSDLVRPLRLVAFSLLPLTLLNLLLAATKGLKIMVYDALVLGLTLPLTLLLLAIPTVWLDKTASGLCLAYTGASVVSLLLAIRLFRRHFSITKAVRSPSKKIARRILHFSTPLGLHDSIQYLVIKLEIFILAYFVTATELGIYALAVELAFIIKKFRQMFDPILIPVISEMHGQGEMQRVQDNVVRVIRWVLTLSILYVGAMALFGQHILLIFGKTFTQGSLILILLCVAQLINANTGLFDLVMMVSGRTKINLLNACILLVIQTGFYLWLVPRLGLLGAALGTLGSITILSLIRLYQSLTILKLRLFHWTQLKPVGAGAAAVLMTLLLQRLIGPLNQTPFLWLGRMLLYVAVYLFTIFLLGLQDEDRFLLRRIFRKKRG